MLKIVLFWLWLLWLLWLLSGSCGRFLTCTAIVFFPSCFFQLPNIKPLLHLTSLSFLFCPLSILLQLLLFLLLFCYFVWGSCVISITYTTIVFFSGCFFQLPNPLLTTPCPCFSFVPSFFLPILLQLLLFLLSSLHFQLHLHLHLHLHPFFFFFFFFFLSISQS